MGVVKHDDVAFLKNCDSWPNYPVCPIKRGKIKDDTLCCALVYAHNGKCILVMELNIFDNPSDDECKDAKSWNYDTVEDLVADGWIVD